MSEEKFISSQQQVDHQEDNKTAYWLPEDQQNSKGSIKEQILEIDLNQIFHMSYSFDLLKKVIEKIVQELDTQDKKFNSELNKLKQQIDNQNQSSELEKMMNLISQQNDKIQIIEQKQETKFKEYDEQLKQMDEFNQKLSDLQDQLNKSNDLLQQKIDTFDQKYKDLLQRIIDIENKLLLLKSMQGGGDLSALEEMIENLKADMRERFVKQHEFNDYSQKVDMELKRFDTQDIILQDHLRRINLLEKREMPNYDGSIMDLLNQYEEFKQFCENKFGYIDDKLIYHSELIQNKVECSTFDEEINIIKNLINQLQQMERSDVPVTQIISTNQPISSKEINRINSMENKIGQLEDLLHKLIKDMSQLNINDLKEQIADLQKNIVLKQDKQEFQEFQEKTVKDIEKNNELIRQLFDKFRIAESKIYESQDQIQKNVYRLDKLEASIYTLKTELNELKSIKLDEKKSKIVEQTNNINYDDDFNDIQKKIQELEKEIASLRQDIKKAFQNVQEQLNQKTSLDQLNELDQKIQDKMNELFQAIMIKFVEKPEFKKALKQIDQQLKNLYDLLMSLKQTNQNENEDDAMFARKPLGGWSCASCEKNLINLQANMAEYNPWKGLPFKEPYERISKYGAGFSKMLSMLKYDQNSQSNYYQTNPLMNQSQTNFSKGRISPIPMIQTLDDQNAQPIEISNSQLNTKQLGVKTSSNFFTKNVKSQDKFQFPNLKGNQNKIKKQS